MWPLRLGSGGRFLYDTTDENVKSRLENIYSKLDAIDRRHAIIRAAQFGLSKVKVHHSYARILNAFSFL